MPILAIITTFTAAATVFLLLRLYARFWFVRSPGVDDCLMVASLMADYVFYAFAVVEIHHGLSHPQKTLPAPETKTQLKALWLTVPFYNLSLILTKLSMLVLYMRIFPTPTFLLTSRIISAVIVVLGLWMVVSSFVFCVPVSAFWNTGLEGRCLPEVVWYLNASLQIATDVTIVVFPMPVLGSLKLPGREKVGVMLVFGVGVFVCAVSAVRLWALRDMVLSRDVTRTNGPATLWSSIETNVAIICASLPALYPLLTRLFPRLVPSSLRSKSKTKSKTKSSGSPSDISLAGASRIFREDGVAGAGYRADVVGGARTGVDGDVEMEGRESRDDGEGIKVAREVRLDSGVGVGDGVEGEGDEGPGGGDGGEGQMEDAVEQEEEWELEWRERLERKRRRREEEAAHS